MVEVIGQESALVLYSGRYVEVSDLMDSDRFTWMSASLSARVSMAAWASSSSYGMGKAIGK